MEFTITRLAVLVVITTGLFSVAQPKQQALVLSKTPSLIEEGARLEVNCTANVLKAPKNMWWSAPSRGQSNLRQVNMSSNHILLVVPRITQQDSGLYFCGMITADNEVETTSFQVSVQPARDAMGLMLQTLVLSKTSSRAFEGSKVQVNCTANVPTAPKSLRWTGHSSMQQDYKGTNSVLLIISKVKRADAGLYTCEMEMEDSRVEKAEFRLFVKPRDHDIETCSVTQFKCTKTRLCIFMRFRCDGKNDCGDGSDEECEGDPCEGKFICNNSRCIDMSQRCNHNDDCGDHSDEGEFCYSKSTTTAEPSVVENHFTWLKTTVYTVIACTLGLVILISFVIIMVFSVKMKRRRSQRMAHLMENMQETQGDPNLPSGQGSQQPFLSTQQNQYGNIIVNVNNGVQYMPGYDYPIFMDAPPPYSELNSGSGEGGSTVSPPPYSTIDRTKSEEEDDGRAERGDEFREGRTSDPRHQEMTQSVVQNRLGGGRSGHLASLGRDGLTGSLAGRGRSTMDPSSNQRLTSENFANEPQPLGSTTNTLQGLNIDSEFLQSLLASHAPGSAATLESIRSGVMGNANMACPNQQQRADDILSFQSGTSNSSSGSSPRSTGSNPSGTNVPTNTHLSRSSEFGVSEQAFTTHGANSDTETSVVNVEPQIGRVSFNNVQTSGDDSVLASTNQLSDPDLTNSTSSLLPPPDSDRIIVSSSPSVLSSPSRTTFPSPHSFDEREESSQPLLGEVEEDIPLEEYSDVPVHASREIDEAVGEQYEDSTMYVRHYEHPVLVDLSGELSEESSVNVLMPHSPNQGLDNEMPDTASSALLQEVARRDRRNQPKPGHLSVQGGQILLHTQEGVLASDPLEDYPGKDHLASQLVSENRPASNIPWLNGELCVQDGNVMLRVPNKPVPLGAIAHTSNRGSPAQSKSRTNLSESSSNGGLPDSIASHGELNPNHSASPQAVVHGSTTSPIVTADHLSSSAVTPQPLLSPLTAGPSPSGISETLVDDTPSPKGRMSGELQVKDGCLILEAPKHTPSSQILSHLQGAYAAAKDKDSDAECEDRESVEEALDPVLNTKRHGSTVVPRPALPKLNTDIVLPFKNNHQS